MALSNEIILRPRFRFDIDICNEDLLRRFDSKDKSEFIITRVDDHVFIRFPKKNQHFWSPQLHLEINEINEKSSTVRGLFGPNPTIWTMFMFLHFVVAGFFIAFGIWAYTNAKLGEPYAVQLAIALMMIAFWFVLYFAGRMGRAKGKPEMEQLFKFMRTTILEN
ncbi:GTP-binding protein [uncultured Winogradskyella sp.]|uniref:GTP-binding protein n=1 Tax=uncultured Winogradskyella sp. TaxID=395353 RepID=UPI003512A6F6